MGRRTVEDLLSLGVVLMEALPLEVPCPWCGARPGVECRVPSGGRAPSHLWRRELAGLPQRGNQLRAALDLYLARFGLRTDWRAP